MPEQTIELSPLHSALVIVDMQAEGCERHGAGVKPVIGNIRKLLDRFREADGKIIHVQSVRTKDHPSSRFSAKNTRSSMTLPPSRSCRSSSRSAMRWSSKNTLMTAFIRLPWKRS